jgi:hypothetical protein
MHVLRVSVGFGLAAVAGAVAGFVGFGLMSAPETWYVFWSDPLHQVLTMVGVVSATLGYLWWLERGR